MEQKQQEGWMDGWATPSRHPHTQKGWRKTAPTRKNEDQKEEKKRKHREIQKERRRECCWMRSLHGVLIGKRRMCQSLPLLAAFFFLCFHRSDLVVEAQIDEESMHIRMQHVRADEVGGPDLLPIHLESRIWSLHRDPLWICGHHPHCLLLLLHCEALRALPWCYQEMSTNEEQDLPHREEREERKERIGWWVRSKSESAAGKGKMSEESDNEEISSKQEPRWQHKNSPSAGTKKVWIRCVSAAAKRSPEPRTELRWLISADGWILVKAAPWCRTDKERRHESTKTGGKKTRQRETGKARKYERSKGDWGQLKGECPREKSENTRQDKGSTPRKERRGREEPGEGGTVWQTDIEKNEGRSACEISQSWAASRVKGQEKQQTVWRSQILIIFWSADKIFRVPNDPPPSASTTSSPDMDSLLFPPPPLLLLLLLRGVICWAWWKRIEWMGSP